MSDCKVKILDKTGSGIASISLKYLQHWLSAGHRNGHGIHSPYLYNLVRNAIFNKAGLRVPAEILMWHRELKKRKEKLLIREFGAGSRYTSIDQRTVAGMVKHASVSERQGALLFRLCSWYRPELVIEFGTGLGISTGYLAAGAKGARVLTIEGNPVKHAFSAREFPETLSERVEFIRGSFDDHLERMIEKAGERTIVFIDGDHRYGPTVEKVNRFLKEKYTSLMFLLDDLYWSEEMEAAWKKCYDHSGVDISIDLFRLGLLIRQPGIEKQHLRVSF